MTDSLLKLLGYLGHCVYSERVCYCPNLHRPIKWYVFARNFTGPSYCRQNLYIQRYIFGPQMYIQDEGFDYPVCTPNPNFHRVPHPLYILNATNEYNSGHDEMYQMALPSIGPHSILNSVQGLAHSLHPQQISHAMLLYFVG